MRRRLLICWTVIAVATALTVSFASGITAILLNLVESRARQDRKEFGSIEFVYSGSDFFEEWNPEAGRSLTYGVGVVAPFVALEGTIADPDDKDRTSLNVSVIAVDRRFWQMAEVNDVAVPEGTKAIIPFALARQANIAVGDRFSLTATLDRFDMMPLPLREPTRRKEEVELIVGAILDDQTPVSRLDLIQGQSALPKVFVPLDLIRNKLGLRGKSPFGMPSVVANGLAVDMFEEESLNSPHSLEYALDGLNELPFFRMDLSDLGIASRSINHAELSFNVYESSSGAVSERLLEMAEQSASQIHRLSPILAQRIDTVTAEDPSNVLTEECWAVGVTFDAPEPWGPFQFVAGGPPIEGAPPEGPGDAIPVVVSEWLAADLLGIPVRERHRLIVAKRMDPEEYKTRFSEMTRTITAHYKIQDAETAIEERVSQFVVTGICRFDDRHETRRFGYPSELQIRLAEQQASTGNALETDADHAVFYGSTPKLFLRLSDARTLWGTPERVATSLRVVVGKPATRELIEATFEQGIVAQRRRDPNNARFRPVRSEVNDTSALSILPASAWFEFFATGLLGTVAIVYAASSSVRSKSDAPPAARIRYRSIALAGLVLCLTGALAGTAMTEPAIGLIASMLESSGVITGEQVRLRGLAAAGETRSMEAISAAWCVIWTVIGLSIGRVLQLRHRGEVVGPPSAILSTTGFHPD